MFLMMSMWVLFVMYNLQKLILKQIFTSSWDSSPVKGPLKLCPLHCQLGVPGLPWRLLGGIHTKWIVCVYYTYIILPIIIIKIYASLAIQQKQYCKSVRCQKEINRQKSMQFFALKYSWISSLFKTWQSTHSNSHFLWMGNQGPTHYSVDVHTASSSFWILNLCPSTSLLRLTSWGGYDFPSSNTGQRLDHFKSLLSPFNHDGEEKKKSKFC